MSLFPDLSKLVPAIKEILNKNYYFSFSELYRSAYNLVLYKHGGELYNWVIGLIEEHLDEVQKRIVSTLYAGDISSFDVNEIVEIIWREYLEIILNIKEVLTYMDRVYCKETRKATTVDACTDLFQRKIKLVFPIQVQERLASALLCPVHVQRSSTVQYFVNKVQNLCSVSFEDPATIQSSSLIRRNSSDVIINADIVFKDPCSGETICILSSVDFVIKRHITSLLCKDSLVNKIDHNRFIKRESIGEGGFGMVYSAEWEGHREKVILKYVKSNPNIGKFIEDVRNFNKEMRIHRIVSDHVNIITFYGMAQDFTNQQFAMILQYADGGTLRKYLEYNFENLTWFDKLRLAKEITNGLLWIHNKKIIHRDLHSNNILIHQHRIKISDFGLSEIIGHSTQAFVGGMPAYMEPQLFISNKSCLDEKSDVYSLGVLLWEISSGRIPFNSKSPEEVITFISNNGREMPIHGTLIKYISLYQECWQQDPQLRPTTEEVLKRLESIPIDSVTESQTLKYRLNPVLTTDTNSLFDRISNLSTEYDECDDDVNELDINNCL